MLTINHLIEGNYYCIKNHNSINPEILFKAEKVGCTHKKNYVVLKAIICTDKEVGELILVKEATKEKKYKFQRMAPPPTSCC